MDEASISDAESRDANISDTESRDGGGEGMRMDLGAMRFPIDFGQEETVRDPLLTSFDLQGVAEKIKSGECSKIVIMAGAGISVSAGIPDFRTPGTGLYDNLQKYNLPHPTDVFSIEFFKQNPAPFYQLAKELFPGQHKPTPTHHFMRLLHDKGLLLRCFTQNIDSLESEAGVPKDKIVAAHGNFDTAHCVDTKAEVPVEEVKKAIMTGEQEGGWPDMNAKWGGLVKPDIVFFGEPLPTKFFALAGIPLPEAQALGLEPDFPQCDLLIIMGTSLTVQPFCNLTELVPDSTPRLLINMQPAGMYNPIAALMGKTTGLRYNDPTNYRDVFFQGPCDAGVWELAGLLGWQDDLAALCNAAGTPLPTIPAKPSGVEEEREVETEDGAGAGEVKKKGISKETAAAAAKVLAGILGGNKSKSEFGNWGKLTAKQEQEQEEEELAEDVMETFEMLDSVVPKFRSAHRNKVVVVVEGWGGAETVEESKKAIGKMKDSRTTSEGSGSSRPMGAAHAGRDAAAALLGNAMGSSRRAWDKAWLTQHCVSEDRSLARGSPAVKEAQGAGVEVVKGLVQVIGQEERIVVLTGGLPVVQQTTGEVWEEVRKKYGHDTQAFHGVPLQSFLNPVYHGLPDQFWGWQFGTTLISGEGQEDSLEATEGEADIAVIVGVGDEDAPGGVHVEVLLRPDNYGDLEEVDEELMGEQEWKAVQGLGGVTPAERGQAVGRVVLSQLKGWLSSAVEN